jgi:hypothetical protein
LHFCQNTFFYGVHRGIGHRIAMSPRILKITAFASNNFRMRALTWRLEATASRKQEHSMGTVMVKCPDTGRDISTGILADRASFNATPVFFARVYCPLCQTEHEWFAKEAWVCDSESLLPQCAA